MNWLDGIIGFISPEWGARREAWRQSLTEMRNYDAGNYDRGNANWRVLNQSAEFTDRYSRDNVRARARDLERNSDMMNSVIGAYKRNVIGGGYALQAKTGSDKTNEIIQTAWKKWCKKQNCDVTGTQSFTQMMRMCVKRKKVDGGILIIKRYTKDGSFTDHTSMKSETASRQTMNQWCRHGLTQEQPCGAKASRRKRKRLLPPPQQDWQGNPRTEKPRRM